MTKLLLLRIIGNQALDALQRADAAAIPLVAQALEQTVLGHLKILRAQCEDRQPFAGLARAYLSELEAQIATMRGA